MSEKVKTISFVVVATVLVGLAVLTHRSGLPKAKDDFKLVGLPFYEDFTSSSQAKSLEVSAIDPDSLELRTFSVKKKGGLWRIPSHHDYPAEAAARLAETATSVMGLERESLAGRMASEHEKLGVVDPLDDERDTADPESTGQRVTLRDANGDAVVDYIIGKAAGEVERDRADDTIHEGVEPQRYFFVRRADEQQTYKVRLDIDLSTNFSDWIDPDLLHLENSQLKRMKIDNYTLAEDNSNPLAPVRALIKNPGDQLILTRESNSAPWVLEGLNEEKEELAIERVNEITEILSQLTIAGVRPKYKYDGHLLLTPELTLNQQPEWAEHPERLQRAVDELMLELQDRGFSLAGLADGGLELASENGQLEVGTNEGVQYVLHVGRDVDGEDKEIEVGGVRKKTENDGSNEPGKEQEKGAADPPETESDLDDVKNRFLMVRVGFREDLLGERPTEPQQPTAPEKPEGYQPEAKQDNTTSESSSDQEDPTDDAKVEEEPKDDGEDLEAEKSESEKPETEVEERDPKFVQYEKDLEVYEQAQIDFELALSRYQEEQKAYEEKIKEGKKKVNELNERFGDWYYVVTGDNLKILQTTRKELVKVNEPPVGQTSEPGSKEIPEKPDISFPEVDGL